MEVLKNYNQVIDARKIMRKLNISFVDSPLKYFLRRLKLIKTIEIGDVQKSWDVYNFIKFSKKNVRKEDSILDIGCYSSEFILSLSKLGYKNITGIDLNKGIYKMPFQEKINYKVANFMDYQPKNTMYKVVSAVSVIEHGFNKLKFLKSMSKIIIPGGFLLISFDYWDDKIDTSKTKLFNMDWNIFSKKEMQKFIKDAEKHNFFPLKNPSFKCYDKAISHVGYNYTFGMIIFVKK
jgi:2-polyprenyl-3-methyl-5-hydroxy-6-metoxy-1,4-benzoquinol methylase|tara:strand:+ start:22 stop:726 length:705 start_codon:yes stop_codon:yes gene_type:complete